MPRQKKEKEPNDYFTWEEEKKPKTRTKKLTAVIDLETNPFFLSDKKMLDLIIMDESGIISTSQKDFVSYHLGTKSGRVSSKGPNMQTLRKR